MKSAADGHRLRTPGPLLDLVEHLLRGLAGVPDAKIVILISPELNYFQHPHTQLKDLAAELSLNIPGAPSFPEQLGFIAIPYSQGGSVFTNTIIFHELGHFVFEQLSKWDDIAGPAEQALKTWSQFSTLMPADQQWCRDRLRSWAEETFCDLFALGLVGPAYAFASIELFSLLGILDEESSKDFQSSHPAHGFRFREHLIQLRSHGWWSEIARLQTDHIKLIKERSALPETTYRFPEGPKRLIRCFLRMRRSIRKLVHEVIGNQLETLTSFRKQRLAIQECLLNGVVPSALGETEDKDIRVAIINASACVYLASLSKLVQKVRGRSSHNLADRSEMARRLEMWTMKALEDCMLLTGRR